MNVPYPTLFATITLAFLLVYRGLFLGIYFLLLKRRWSTTLLVLLLPFTGFVTGIVREVVGVDFNRIRRGVVIIIIAITIFFIIGLETAVNIIILFLYLHPELSLSDMVREITHGTFSLYIALIFYGGIILACLSLSKNPATLGWKRKKKIGRAVLYGILGAVAMLAILIVYFLLISLFFPNLKSPSNVPEMRGRWEVLYFLISAALLAPVGEETFFRGLLYETLKRRWGWVASALTSALLFSIAHISLISILPIFFGGIILAYLKEKNDWLLPPVITHSTYNTIIVLIAVFL
ncbi:MAG: CPBP family intramembrane metalloprotease [Thermoplasmata archaeon]|nr:CPBP family intramembrane metalloprotease [Thermoplasmata archaeon]